MAFNKPFHRNYRPVKKGINSGYSDWAYIVDREYAQHPEHYTRAFSIIQQDIFKLFEYIEPSEKNCVAYSFRIHELLMRTCIEVEANFKAILKENTYKPIFQSGKREGLLRPENEWNINDFKKVNKTHHLDDYIAELPFWKGQNKQREPFRNWKNDDSLDWYQAYNQSKHDRINNFEKSNFGNLIDSYSGLFILLSSQFRTVSFYPGNQSLGINTDSYYDGDFGIGGFLLVNFPQDWSDNEIYDFDWSKLKQENERFQKLDYNVI